MLEMSGAAHVRNDTVWALLSDAARRRGDAPALLGTDRPALSYRALADQTAALARGLRAAGVGRTDRVAVLLPNGPELAAAFVGVAAAAACAPLNPAYTREDFGFYLEDVRARALIVDDSSRHVAVDAARALGIDVLRLRRGPEAGAISLGVPDGGLSIDWPEPAATALLLHTSGTTSRPKLVPLTGRHLTAGAAHVAATLALGTSDRCLNIMPLFHIHGQIGSILASLHAGSAVVCTDGVYAGRFYAWMRELRPTWFTAVPTMHQTILAGAKEHEDVIRAARLRFIRSCSAALPPMVLEALERVFRTPVIESYGMTEASLQITSNPLPPGRRKPGSVGTAAGPEVAIMGADGDLLEPGAVGEVVIRGPNVIDAYEANEAANRAAFTNGWFRTGDQGWLDDEGYLSLTGRLKEQINRGGEKISPREIDEALLAHPGVRQAAAFAVPHRQLGEEVGAAIELQPGSALTPGDLRRWAGTRLPAFKVPRIIRVVESIPRGPTGKLQRLGLADTLGVNTLDDRASLAEYIAPRNELEGRIAAVWREFLPGVRVGVHDRFDALGGDSLLAATMLAAVGSITGVDVPLTRFVEEATVAALSADIEALREGTSLLLPLQPEGAGPPLHIVPGHEGSLYAITRLARALGTDQPVWTFDLRRMNGARTVEELAGRCVSLLRARHRGPYRLAGSCFGGVLAFEMARQIQAVGGTVECLVLIEALHPRWRDTAGGLGAAAARLRQSRVKLRHHSAKLRQHRTAGSALRYVLVRGRAFFRNNGQIAAARLGAKPSLGATTLSLAFRYTGGTYTGTALVFRVPGLQPDVPALGWRQSVNGRVDIVDLPCHCEGALSERNLPVVAEAIRAKLMPSPVRVPDVEAST